MDDIYKFSNHFKRSLKDAAEIALELGSTEVEPRHLLYGIVSQRGSLGAEVFTMLNIPAERVTSAIRTTARDDVQPPAENAVINFSEPAKEAIEKSAHLAYINEHPYIGTEHLLAALLELRQPDVFDVLRTIHLGEQALVQQLVGILKSTSRLSDMTGTFNVKQRGETTHDRDASPLDTYGTNLTSRKIQKTIDPVIGRETEIERIIQILARRQKNNPLLIGDPGVGKTAIVEGLAKRIMLGDVPTSLQHKQVYALDLTATVAGTMYRGEFEQRIRQIIEEAKKRPEVILFIDEIHNIVGAGSASGSMDAANILKPALARGEIRCIGTTTRADYRTSIENDPALERRFQVVAVEEPTTEQAMRIIDGVKNYYETFHHVTIDDTAVRAAVELGQKYLPDKFLPDKALDLIDEASARVAVRREPTELELRIAKLNKELESARDAKRQAVEREDYAAAREYRDISVDIEARLTAAETRQKAETTPVSALITSTEIAAIVASVTGIPVGDLLASERRRLANLDRTLMNTVIGQDQAMTVVSSSIKRATAGLAAEHRPLASFLFVGPSGVGKTYTAKMLAKFIFGDEKALIRIDMSEYSERFTISKLIGAPAGYVGYKESGHLSEKIKHKPYSVVLFDELEKADPSVFDLLLQVLDDGYLTDATGAKINFENTIIVMTSNIGSQLFTASERIGFDRAIEAGTDLDPKVDHELRDWLKPEFLNRLDAVVHFKPLTQADLKKITRVALDTMAQRLKERHDLTLDIAPRVLDQLARDAATTNQGARGITRLLQQHIETPLADLLLQEAILPGSTMRVSAKNGIIEVKN